MVGARVGSIGSSGLDASQNATKAKQSEGRRTSKAPSDKDLNIPRQLLEKLRTFYPDEDYDGIIITTKDVADAVRAFIAHNKA